MSTALPDMPDEPDGSAAALAWEMAERAHICARAHWAYPDASRTLQNAIDACEVVGVDYVDLLAKTIADGTHRSFESGRRVVAEYFRVEADRWYENKLIAEHADAATQRDLDAARDARLARQQAE